MAAAIGLRKHDSVSTTSVRRTGGPSHRRCPIDCSGRPDFSAPTWPFNANIEDKPRTVLATTNAANAPGAITIDPRTLGIRIDGLFK